MTEQNELIDGKIYLIINKTNGMMYVGQTIMLLRKRWNSHCKQSSIKAGTKLGNAIGF